MTIKVAKPGELGALADALDTAQLCVSYCLSQRKAIGAGSVEPYPLHYIPQLSTLREASVKILAMHRATSKAQTVLREGNT